MCTNPESALSRAQSRPDVVLDLSRLMVNCNGKSTVVRELLVHLQQKSGPQWLAALHDAIAVGNPQALQEICHGMKGACATVFAWRLSNLALEFEHLARDGEVESLSGRMEELQGAFDELALWLQKYPEFS